MKNKISPIIIFLLIVFVSLSIPTIFSSPNIFDSKDVFQLSKVVKTNLDFPFLEEVKYPSGFRTLQLNLDKIKDKEIQDSFQIPIPASSSSGKGGSKAVKSDIFVPKGEFSFGGEKEQLVIYPTVEKTNVMRIDNEMKKRKEEMAKVPQEKTPPEMISQKEIKKEKIKEMLKKDPEFKKVYEYAQELEYVELNNAMEISYDNGITVTFSEIDKNFFSNISDENLMVLMNVNGIKNSFSKSFLMEITEENGTDVLKIFDKEGGVKINLSDFSMISSWGHHSCAYWDCVWYSLEWFSNNYLLFICGRVCTDSCFAFPSYATCGACLTCFGALGLTGLELCADVPGPPDNCYFYPCQEDCTERNVDGLSEYYCNENNKTKHVNRTAYKCSSTEPREGFCIYDSAKSGWKNDTLVETCTYGCDETTGNCKGAITCYDDNECGDSDWTGSPYCSGGDVWQYYRTYTCSNPGTESSSCSNSNSPTLEQECTSGICENGECVGDVSCENPFAPYGCDGGCWGCYVGENPANDQYSLCCPDGGGPSTCCSKDGPYCDTSTGECTLCGGDYPDSCNNQCWSTPPGGYELCCPDSGDPQNWCNATASTCMSDGSCCTPAAEICNNQDDDCDGVIDNFNGGCGVGTCTGGTRTCTAGSWGACSTAGNSANETCNNIDDDCDGSVDESLSQECGSDTGECVKGTQTCSAGQWGECGGSYVGPINETCDSLDNNCNNITDEDNVCGNYPNVTLIFPTNNYVDDTGNISFNCSIDDDSNLANITLYHNLNGSTYLNPNETKLISGTSNSTTWLFNNISIGNYMWNCLAYDNDSHWSWSWNGPFSLTMTFPGLINTFADGEYEKNLEYNQTGNQTVYIRIPKNANVTSAYLNLSGYDRYPDEIDKNQLSDGLTIKDLFFVGKENQTIYITIPAGANVTEAYINLSGYGTNSSSDNYDIGYNKDIVFGDLTSSGINAWITNEIHNRLEYNHTNATRPCDGSHLDSNYEITQIFNLSVDLGSRLITNTSIHSSVFFAGDIDNENTFLMKLYKYNFNTSAWILDYDNSENFTNFGGCFINDAVIDIGTENINSNQIMFKYNLKFIDDYIYGCASLDANLTSCDNLNVPAVDDTQHQLLKFQINYTFENYTSDTWLEVGNVDGVKEWNVTGNFYDKSVRLDNFSDSVNDYLIGKSGDANVSLKFHSDSTGRIEINGIQIKYFSNITNPYLEINGTQIWNYIGKFDFENNRTEDFSSTLNLVLNNCVGDAEGYCNISIISYSGSAGKLKLLGVEIYYNLTDNPPNVSLINPLDNNVSSTGNVTFVCNVTDDEGLSNITLYTNINGTWQANQSKTITGTSKSTNFTINNIPDDISFIWNCLAYDDEAQGGWGGSNWTINISISNTAPIIINLTQYPTSLYRGQDIEIRCAVHDNETINSSLNISIQYQNVTNNGYIECTNLTYDSTNEYWKCNYITNYSDDDLGSFDFRCNVSDGELSSGWITDTDTVTVLNNLPEIYACQDDHIYEDTLGSEIQVDLDDCSSDLEDSDNNLVYQINNQTNTSLIDCYLSGHNITCNDPSPNQYGYNYLEVQVNDTDGGTNISYPLILVSVNPVNDPPIVSLESPVNNSEKKTSNIIFSYNVTDIDSGNETYSGIDNCSLILNNQINQTGSPISKDVTQNFTVILADGNYNWSINCTDTSNNISASITYKLLVDTTPPNITSLIDFNESGIIDGGVNQGDNISFNVTVTDEDSEVESVWLKIWQGAIGISNVIWQGFLNFVSGNLWTTSIETNESFGFGEVNYSVYANDTLGNEATGYGTFNINNLMINILYPTNNSYGKNVSSLNYSVVDDNAESCWYSVNGGVSNSSAVGAGVNFTNMISVEGSNSWVVYCNDTDGNEGAGSVSFYKETTGLSVSVCRVLSNANTEYTQAGDIYQHLNENCIVINAGNITYNGNGYSISSGFNVSGIFSDEANTTIKNCNINMGNGLGGYGILGSETNGLTVINNTLNNQYYGLYVYNVAPLVVEDSTADNNNYGFYIRSVSNSSLNGNSANNNSYGIYIDGGSYSVLNQNNANNNEKGINVYQSANASLTNNVLSGNSYGIQVEQNGEGISIDYLINNSATGNTYGYYFSPMDNSFLINSSAISNTYGISLRSGSDNNRIIDSNFSLNSNADVKLDDDSDNNSFVNSSYFSEDVNYDSELFRKWYYKAYVNDSSGNGVSGVSVIGDNKNGELVFSLLTDGAGWSSIGEIIEYANTGTKNYYSDYTLKANNGTHYDSHYFNASLNINKLDDWFSLNPLPDDADKYYVKDDLGNNVAWFGIDGNIVLKGSCFVGTCSAPADSFVIKNGTNTVAYIDSNGDLCLETDDCSDNSGSCSVNNAFKIRNATEVVSYIDSTGELCLVGGLYEEIEL